MKSSIILFKIMTNDYDLKYHINKEERIEFIFQKHPDQISIVFFFFFFDLEKSTDFRRTKSEKYEQCHRSNNQLIEMLMKMDENTDDSPLDESQV